MSLEQEVDISDSAKSRAGKAKMTEYDSQGYFNLFSDNSLNPDRMTRVDVLCTDKLDNFVNHLCDKHNQDNFKTAVKALYTESPHQGMINLEQEMRFYLAGKLQAYKKCLPEGVDGNRFDKLFQKSMTNILPEIREEFKKALWKSFEQTPDPRINLQKLNETLDGLRSKFQKKVLSQFESEIQNKKLPRIPQKKLKQESETTSAFGNIEIIQINPNIKHELTGSSNTAHNKDPKNIADVVYRTKINDELVHSTIRISMMVPNKPSELGAVRDTINNITTLLNKHFQGKPAVFYHLLTSYHTSWLGRLIGDGSNKQTSRAQTLMQAQDQYNLERFQDNSVAQTPLFFTLHTPVNGYGEHISSQHSDEKVKEIAWRNNLALIMMLGNEEQKNRVKSLYKNYLTFKKNKAHLNPLITSINNTIDELSPVDAASTTKDYAKNLLIKMVKARLHESNPELIRLFSSLSLVVNDGNSLVSCKSGNERTAMILNRMERLLENPALLNNKNAKEPQAIINELIALSDELEKEINEQNINGFANHISLNDQHAAPKVEPEPKTKWYHWLNPLNWYNTNAAESAAVNNLVTKGTQKLQAHKDKYALKIASIPELKSKIANTLMAAGAVTVGVLSSLGMVSAAFLAGPIIPVFLIVFGVLGASKNRSEKKSPEFIFPFLALTLGILALTKVLAIGLMVSTLTFSSIFPPLLFLVGLIALVSFGYKQYQNYSATKESKSIRNNLLKPYKEEPTLPNDSTPKMLATVGVGPRQGSEKSERPSDHSGTPRDPVITASGPAATDSSTSFAHRSCCLKH